MELTIKELADELSVSKTAIRKHMDDKFRDTYTIKKGNKILIKDEGVEVLKGQFKNQESHVSKDEPKQTANQLAIKSSDKQTALLAEQLEDQRKQIDAKDKQIAELHQLLDQSHVFSWMSKISSSSWKAKVLLQSSKPFQNPLMKKNSRRTKFLTATSRAMRDFKTQERKSTGGSLADKIFNSFSIKIQHSRIHRRRPKSVAII